MPKPSPRPIQYAPLKKEDFATDSGVAFFNQTLSQITETINALVGGGPVLFPGGLDLRGASVTGLGVPGGPTDAVPLGSATASFGPAAQAQQLDVGKPMALKGLTAAFATSFQNKQNITTLQNQIALAAQVLGTGGDTPLTSPIIQIGDSAAIPTTLAVVFPMAFPNTVPIVVACDDYAGGADSIISVVKTSVTKTGFTLHSNNTSSGAFWIAVGS